MAGNVIVVMDVGSGRNAAFQIREDVALHFGIDTFDPTAAPAELKTRAAYSFTRKSISGSGTGVTVNVKQAQYYAVAKSLKRIAGIPIRVPTGVNTDAGKPRFTLIRVPQIASMMAIVNWIWTEFSDTAKRPGYFITASNVRVPVLNYNVTDVNPGNEAEAPAP